MKHIGAHVKAAGGVENAPLNAMAIGAKAFALFVKPQRKWSAPPFSEEQIVAFTANLKKSNIEPQFVLPHASYLINMAAPNEESRANSLSSLVGEIKRVHKLGLNLINIHPGSFVGQGTREEGIKRIANTINSALAQTEGVRIVLENTAGQGSCLGSSFEEIRDIIDLVTDKNRIGYCIDTAHLWGAGYDISTEENCAHTMELLAKILGYDKIYGMHINDSKVKLGSHTDRHESIGSGQLTMAPFRCIMNNPNLDNIPLILETPNPDLWQQEITTLEQL